MYGKKVVLQVAVCVSCVRAVLLKEAIMMSVWVNRPASVPVSLPHTSHTEVQERACWLSAGCVP